MNENGYVLWSIFDREEYVRKVREHFSFPESITDEEIVDFSESYFRKHLGNYHVVAGNEFLAIQSGSAADLEWVSRFLENHFVSEVVVAPISFNDAVLRNVIQTNPEVFELEHAPARERMRTVDRLRFTDRGVAESEICEEYGEEPLEKIKVRMNDVTEGVTVAFYRRGRVTIYRETDPQKAPRCVEADCRQDCSTASRESVVSKEVVFG